MSEQEQEPVTVDDVQAMVSWLREHGGYWNPAVEVRSDPSCGGFSLFATRTIPAGSKIVECPASLAITREVAIDALSACALSDFIRQDLLELKERQVIAGYVALHLQVNHHYQDQLLHQPYTIPLPSEEQLLVPAFWSEEELGLIDGTNLYYAARSQTDEWERELEELYEITGAGDVPSWAAYALASACISSRAFPSSLAQHGTLNDPARASYPLLLPGLDALNHRAQAKVTWSKNGETGGVAISVDEDVQEGEQVYNNYGAKTTEAFILGYGFAPTPNASDAVTLKLGSGIASGLSADQHSRLEAAGLALDTAYEVGLDGDIPHALWETMRIIVRQSEDDTDDELDMDAHGALADMAEAKLESLDRLSDALPSRADNKEIRLPVLQMCRAYLEGQHAILTSIYERQLREIEG